MQCDILDYLLLFVDIAFGQWHVLLRLQVKLCGKCVAATLSLQGKRQGSVKGADLKRNASHQPQKLVKLKTAQVSSGGFEPAASSAQTEAEMKGGS